MAVVVAGPAQAAPVVNAVSNCGGLAPLKKGCSGGGLLGETWWIEVRSVGSFVGVVNVAFSTVSGSLSLSCTLPGPEPSHCVEDSKGHINSGQSFELEGGVEPLPGLSEAAGQWLISVYSA